MMNFMRLFLFPAFVAILTAEEPTISISDLQSKKIIGHLELPLGDAVTIKAKWIPGRTLGYKAFQSRYFLKVLQVNERVLEEPLLMTFSYSPGWHKTTLPAYWSELEKTSSKIKQGKSSTEEIEKSEKQFIDKEFNLLVYETGRFSGIPNKLPEKFLRWQGTNFGFFSGLVILRHN